MIPEFIFIHATVNLILNSCYWIIFHPLLQYSISSAFSRQLPCITHLLHTYYHFPPIITTSHSHSVVNLHSPLIYYILTIIFHPLLQYNISSAFSRQLTRTTHLLHTYHYYSTTSHPHSVVNLHASLICYILTIIAVQHLIHIQSSTYMHHSSATYLLLFSPSVTSGPSTGPWGTPNKRCNYWRRCFTVCVNRRWAISKIWF